MERPAPVSYTHLAQTAQLYIDKQVIDPSEVRAKLADSEEFDVENMLDEYDDEDLFPDEPAAVSYTHLTSDVNMMTSVMGYAITGQSLEPLQIHAQGFSDERCV